MEKLQKDAVYTGSVEGYSSEGLGIVRLNGAVVFVPQAVRGERADIRITKVMKTAAVGEIVRILQPSPERAAPDRISCAVRGGLFGGSGVWSPASGPALLESQALGDHGL